MSATDNVEPSFLKSEAGEDIAWINDGAQPEAGGKCGFFWLGGFMSDMRGGKATALGVLADRRSRSAVRFDYSGHGASSGSMEDGSIGKWLAEAEQVFREVAKGDRVIIGSSMGGWIALLLYRKLLREAPEEAARIRGLVLLAPAADMTEELMWKAFPKEAQEALMKDGRIEIPSEYGDQPYVITRELIEEGRQHLLLQEGLEVACPVRILQGDRDPDVPWQHALKTFEALKGEDVSFTLIKGADHRLSDASSLMLLGETAEALCVRADARASTREQARQMH